MSEITTFVFPIPLAIKLFTFKRNAKKHGKVLKCTDNKYIPQSEISESDFCKWLCEKYEFQNLDLTFREMIGLYARVWNKPNKKLAGHYIIIMPKQ